MNSSPGLLLTVVTLCFSAKCLDAQGSAFGAEEAIVDNIIKGKFTTVVKDVAGTVTPFLKAFNSVVRLILGIQSSSAESHELQYLRNMSESISRRFDQVDSQFNDVKKLINWSAVQVSYGMLESNIHIASGQFNRIFQVPESGVNEQRKLFITSYQSGYRDSGTKLFTAFMQDQGVISQGLLRPAMEYTRKDRRKMRTFMLGILKLLLMAAKVEIAYLGAIDYNAVVPFYIHDWEIRIEQVKEKMIKTDIDLKNAYFAQSNSDIDRFSQNNTNLRLSNQDFSRNLYEELSTKYYWRDWLVVASTHTEGRHDAHSKVCNGFIKSVYRTKDLVIDSVEHDKANFNTMEVHGLCASLKQTCQNKAYYQECPQYNRPRGSKSKRCGDYVYPSDAIVIFNWFNSAVTSCQTYSSVGIIGTGKNPVYYAGPVNSTSSRLSLSVIGNCDFKVHFFG